jgi:hypothetical protein
VLTRFSGLVEMLGEVVDILYSVSGDTPPVDGNGTVETLKEYSVSARRP